ncbi:hypothetical protein R3P38DRAFT_1460059 [Favolaschia claudopus]|uniref:F-box domain-containing protein n=1 Tax=Favolaschia claudopus TaxID=2862362 RepID=A0AAW0DPN3_9AGAR
MVLTRSASRYARCIIRWFPNEVLGLVMQCLSPADLATLCQTSQLLRNIGTPLLYRSVTLTTSSRLELFKKSIDESPQLELASRVRMFVLKTVDVDGSPAPLVKEISTLLLRMSHLHSLRLVSKAVDFTILLEHAAFPHLTNFEFTVIRPPMGALRTFLNRHRTIRTLRIDTRTRAAFPGRIRLPRLTDLTAFLSAVPAFDLRKNHLQYLTLLARRFDVRADVMPDKLANIHSAASVIVRSFGCRQHLEWSLLAAVAWRFQHVKSLAFVRSTTLSEAEVGNVENILKALHCLRTLDLHRAGESSPEDREVVLKWAAACKAVSVVKFHGQLWKYKKAESQWVVLG